MNSNFKRVSFLTVILLFINCGSNCLFMKKEKAFSENFNDPETFQKNWIDNSWKSPATYQLENNHLKITTRPNTVDRVKIRSKRKFTTGSYTWRIFVPKFKLYEQVSIGAFLYHNQREEFEFDFEIGSGQQMDREKINLKDDEAIVFCVSQFSPSNSSHFPVKMNAYADFNSGSFKEERGDTVKLGFNWRPDIRCRTDFSIEKLHLIGSKQFKEKMSGSSVSITKAHSDGLEIQFTESNMKVVHSG